MGSFGENLKREREMRGITLEEISAATKISVRFLKSIETDEFSALPGGIFRRSFVRAYARYLGLDEDPLIEEYQMAAKTRADVDLSRFSPPNVHSRPEPPTRHTLWAVVIVVILLVLGVALWRRSHRPLQAPPGAKISTAASVRPALDPPNANGSSSQPANSKTAGAGVLATSAVVTPDVPKLPPVADADGRLVLQIATTERSWIAIDADGSMVMQGIMEPNTVKTFKATTSFDVLTGNAQGVILTLNGQTQKSLGREGEVKQVHLTWDSLKNPTSQ
ncbi:MAG TPA: helix-turn-helix domain-containing protein [Terriglobia bacterium]|nr:helix-turn-helix domain-containing protein [Terriglobia bacterium]